MSGRELEDIMYDFINKKIDVLVCTTILESGIDIPNANTIIVENAERLGLAQLYQIRGRVGRAEKQAYAYITYRKDKIINEVADKRLKAIKEFTELGSGFKIALRDLEIRGAGNILGPEQHGHMDAVGYEMYCKLLDESVREMQGEEILPELDTQIDLKVTAYIPGSYIENINQKIEVYQDIANLDKEEQISEIIDELIDRYGEIPKEVYNLLEVAKVKMHARELQVIKISQNDTSVVIQFNNPDVISNAAIQMLIDIYKSKIMFSSGAVPYITLRLQSKKDSDIFKEVLNVLQVLKG
jgi:transcription-repair coupling factor (superfamily II helicase)